MEKAKLIYVGDPMCSWCYGFTNELKNTIDHFGNQIEIEYLMGGLRPYNDETISSMKDFLKSHWNDVNRATQMPFQFGILESGDKVYDTEPACRAVVVVKDLFPGNEQAFFTYLQSQFYYENKYLSNPENMKSFFTNNALDFEKFITHFKSEEYKTKVKLDFERSSQLGATSFPTVLLEYKGEIHKVANGYSTAEKIISKIEKIIS